MKQSLVFTPILICLVFLTGCASLRDGLPQEVVILSFPSAASVYINGQAAGVTPLEIELPRRLNHEIRLEKRGYNSAVKYITPVPNEKSKQLVRFGLSKDLGYYVDLEPGTLKAKMKSELVPTSSGSDPFERMAERAIEADRRLENGEISPLEHKVIIAQIIEFFE
ncbi:MAG: PEGA domain-containing protein [Verrucomicrobiota bacterium]